MALPLEHQCIAAAVRDVGFVRIEGPSTSAGFLELARSLGDVLVETTVRLMRDRTSYLASAGPIPMHTDHPDADYVAWFCEVQDPCDGASLLVDGRAALDALDPRTVEALKRVRLSAAYRPGCTPRATSIFAENGEIFDAPWLDPLDHDAERSSAVQRWRDSVAAREPVSIRLGVGEALVIDNHRMLHGRARLAEQSPRRLRRVWIRRRRA